MEEKIINDFNKHFKNKYKIYKIYEKNGQAIIFADTDIAMDDGIFFYKDEDYIRAITPIAIPDIYKKIVKEDNLIYDITENKEIKHSTEYGKGYYQKIDKYYKDGSTRYFYSPQEWEAYQKNKGQDAYRKEQAKKKEIAKKESEHGYDMSGYNKWKKEQENKEKERLAEERRKKAEETIKRRDAEIKANLDRERERIRLENEEKERRRKFAEETIARREAEIKDNISREQERIRKEKEQKVELSNWLSTNSDSPINIMNSIINFSDGLDEYTPTKEELLDNDQMINDVYLWIAENKEKEETDPKTGLKIKNYDISIEEEMKLVNPGFYYSDEIHNFSQTHNTLEITKEYTKQGDDFMDNSMNCYACTTAMALRQKGYDVTAGKDSDGIDALNNDSEIGEAYDNLWTGKFTEYDYYNSTKKNISEEPPGSYGDFNISWVLPNGLSNGHSIFYKVDYEGNVHYYDCQNGKEMTNSDFDKIMRDADDEYAMYLYSDGTIKTKKTGNKMVYSRYKRLDNQEFVGADAMKEAKKISSTIVIKGGN